MNFVPASFANVIYSLAKEDAKAFCNGALVLNELGEGNSLSKNANALTGEMIKEICLPVKVDRLGRITEINGNKV